MKPYDQMRNDASAAASKRLIFITRELIRTGALTTELAHEAEAIGMLWNCIGLKWSVDWEGKIDGEEV